MGTQGWLALGVLVAAVLLFTKRWLPLEVTALAIPLALLLCGVLDSATQAFAGFGHPAVIALGSTFVIGAGLQESGVTSIVARGIQRLGGRSETTLLIGFMVVVAAVSSVMSNQAVVAVFIPAAMTLSRRTTLPPSRLLIPLSFAAVLGGNLTALGTQGNIIVADLARDMLAEPIGVFEFARVGLPIAALGILFMATIGKRLLPKRTAEQRLREALLPEEVARSYGLPKSLFHMRVPPQSKVCGRTIAEAGIRSRYGLHVVTVARTRKMRQHFLDPRPDLVLAAGDDLYVEGEDEAAWRFADYEVVQFGLAAADEIERILGRGLTLAEVGLAPRAEVFGKTITELDFRNRHGLNVLALWRKGAPVREGLAAVPLEFGDALLVSGPAEKLRGLAANPDFIVLTDHSFDEDVSRAPAAILLLLVALLPPLFDWASLAVSTLAAALLMVATGCVTASRVHRVIDWRVLFLIIGTLPLGYALDHTGVASVIADGVVGATSSLGPAAVIAVVFLMAASLSVATTNSLAAVVVAPIAVSVAAASGVDGHVLFLAVAYGCSCAFMLPHQPWNALVMSPGGYTTADFVRVGGAVSLVVAATAIVGLALS